MHLVTFLKRMGVPMLRGSFVDHYNGFRFFSVGICSQMLRLWGLVPRNILINLVIYARDKKV